jgi:hypothetical protein
MSITQCSYGGDRVCIEPAARILLKAHAVPSRPMSMAVDAFGDQHVAPNKFQRKILLVETQVFVGVFEYL